MFHSFIFSNCLILVRVMVYPEPITETGCNVAIHLWCNANPLAPCTHKITLIHSKGQITITNLPCIFGRWKPENLEEPHEGTGRHRVIVWTSAQTVCCMVELYGRNANRLLIHHAFPLFSIIILPLFLERVKSVTEPSLYDHWSQLSIHPFAFHCFHRMHIHLFCAVSSSVWDEYAQAQDDWEWEKRDIQILFSLRKQQV